MRLEAKELAFGYSTRRVGSGASFALGSGEVLCVLGANGSGKTTLFRTLLGILPPLEGSVLLDGRDASRLRRRERARLMAYVPQAHAGFFPYTVREMVLMGRASHVRRFGTPSLEDEQSAEGALAEMGLAHLADDVYTRTSMGERQLALIARALSQEAEVLILDEPAASLDLGNQMRVIDRLSSLARRGKGIIFSTHNPDHAFLCADRVALLHEGRIIALGRPPDVLSAGNLRALYGIDVSVVRFEGTEGQSRWVCLPQRPVARAAERN